MIQASALQAVTTEGTCSDPDLVKVGRLAASGLIASMAILRTRAAAGSARSTSRPASSRERVVSSLDDEASMPPRSLMYCDAPPLQRTLAWPALPQSRLLQAAAPIQASQKLIGNTLSVLGPKINRARQHLGCDERGIRASCCGIHPFTTDQEHIMLVVDIRIQEIAVPVRIRSLSRDCVAALKTSIGNVGLLNPISVYARADSTMILATGAHRLLAARELGWDSIPAVVFCGSDVDRELAEIDENLCRQELGPAERALHESRRKQLWLAKRAMEAAQQGSDTKTVPDADADEMGGTICATHPTVRQDETTSSDATGRRRTPQQQPGFAASTAAITREAKFAINRNVRRGDELGAVLLDIAGTSLDKGVELDALLKLEAAERMELTARAKAGERVSAKMALETKSQSQDAKNKKLAMQALAALEKCAAVMIEREFVMALKGVRVPENVASLAIVISSCVGGEP